MTPQTFIEKAIEGGFEQPLNKSVEDYTKGDIAQILLNKEAWQAVGKVEGWYQKDDEHPLLVPNLRNKMIGLTQALLDGKTIEEYLLTL